jgi:hypothetical protein
LEDIVEFLAVEQLVDTRAGWAGHVEKGRAGFWELQFRAAVRKHPDIAEEELRTEGHL